MNSGVVIGVLGSLCLHLALGLGISCVGTEQRGLEADSRVINLGTFIIDVSSGHHKNKNERKI